MNSYQRIVRDGRIVQPGCLDTQLKFSQLTADLELRGKAVLDVGCNVGEMCRLAKDLGAVRVKGIDINPEYIRDARRLNPDCTFDVQRSERAVGYWHIVIASAVLHHDGLNLDSTLSQFARIGNTIACDVWLSGDDGPPAFSLDDGRGIFVPNRAAWELIASRHFESIDRKERAESPDGSARWVYHLYHPKPKPAQAMIIFGQAGSGKTSMARELTWGYQWEHLQTDQCFVDLKMSAWRGREFEVSWQLQALRGDSFEEYWAHHADYIERWLTARQNLDVVIEGYDLVYPDFRQMVVKKMHENGWADVREVEL